MLSMPLLFRVTEGLAIRAMLPCYGHALRLCSFLSPLLRCRLLLLMSAIYGALLIAAFVFARAPMPLLPRHIVDADAIITPALDAAHFCCRHFADSPPRCRALFLPRHDVIVISIYALRY